MFGGQWTSGKGLFLFPSCGDGIQVVRPGCKHLYPLSHLEGPDLTLLRTEFQEYLQPQGHHSPRTDGSLSRALQKPICLQLGARILPGPQPHEPSSNSLMLWSSKNTQGERKLQSQRNVSMEPRSDSRDSVSSLLSNPILCFTQNTDTCSRGSG